MITIQNPYPDDKGEPVRKLIMFSCRPTPEAHALFHTPAPEKVIVYEIMVLMKNAQVGKLVSTFSVFSKDWN